MSATDVTITYLEMRSLDALRPRLAARGGLSLALVDPPSAEVNARLYGLVGAGYQWNDRLAWSDAEWNTELRCDGTETWILSADGAEAGFFELTMPAAGIREILYLGLLPGSEGQGLGAHLLTLAVQRAWTAGAGRVIVNTCTLDHPGALPNYLARGFEIVGTKTERRELREHA